jgi:flagellar hook-basal body complex protein FliE
MSDPVGLIGASGGVDPSRKPGVGGGWGGGEGGSFKDVLLENINQVNELQQDATKAIEDLAAGRRDDLEGVLMATQKADTAFRMLQAVRNKVLTAYEEIKSMRV